MFGDKIYVFNENQLDNCANSGFDTSKLTFKIETTDIHQGWDVCEIKMKKGEEYSSATWPPRSNSYNPDPKYHKKKSKAQYIKSSARKDSF